ncbi:MAG: tripartite tricarboxylate transporter substrate binding protein [Desulfobacteraceae bacterium]|nr:MAG: tripartite tricarboxylate transporter substrate binding protein [Desulfobacteraceae bacterium]
MDGKSVRLLIVALAVSLVVGGSLAVSDARAEFPEGPIRMLVAFTPGGSMDISVRAISAAAEKQLGKPIVIENKGGGGGTVALGVLANEKPDGYTLCGATTSGLIRSPLMQKVIYKPLKSFTPIIGFAYPQLAIMVPNESPFKDLKELLDYAKKNPNKIKYGTTGPGSGQHVQMELLAHQLGINWVHIPYKGSQDAIMALLGGHIDVASVGPEFVPVKRANQARVLAVCQSKKSPNFPEIPTIPELGYNVVDEVVFCIVGPAGMPPQVLQKLEKAFKDAMESQEFKKAVEQLDLITVYYNNKDFQKYMEECWLRTENSLKETGVIKEAATSPR